MGGRETQEFPVALRRAAERFLQWRRNREGRTRVPETLWAVAADLAGRYGVCRTASTLKLNYYRLKRRVVEHPRSMPTYRPACKQTFVQLPTAAIPSREGCVIELENSAGSRMRIQLNGVGVGALVPLVRGFQDAQ